VCWLSSKGVAVITGLAYPSRVAIQLLQELYGDFAKQFGAQAQTAAANSLTRKCKNMLTAICKKYDDVTKIDKSQALLGKVDEVKVHMQDNIAGMLRNTEHAESLAEKSDILNEQASVFKKKSTDLRKHMQCKNMKMTALLVGIVVVILLVILISVIVKVKQATHH
jgi:vesicle-associated membrane protein 7